VERLDERIAKPGRANRAKACSGGAARVTKGRRRRWPGIRKEADRERAKFDQCDGTGRRKVSGADLRARRIADLKSGDFFKLKGRSEVAEASTRFPTRVDRNSCTASFPTNLPLRLPRPRAPEEVGTESCLAPLRECLKSSVPLEIR